MMPGEYDIVINIQGDEPLIDPHVIDDVVKALQDSPDSVYRSDCFQDTAPQPHELSQAEVQMVCMIQPLPRYTDIQPTFVGTSNIGRHP